MSLLLVRVLGTWRSRWCVWMAVLAVMGQSFVHALDPGLPPSGNFDLTHWYLTLPDANATMIKPSTLANGYSNATWFYTGEDGAMVFWCPVNGGTTSGATYPRSELRENIEPGVNSVNWRLAGTHLLDAQCKVTQIPSNGRVVIGQIHSYLGNAYELIVLNYIAGNIYVQLRVSPNGTTKTNFLAATVPLNELITYQIKVVDGVLTVTVNGTVFVANLLALDPAWGDNTFYFKAGSYVHDNVGDSSEGSRVAFYSLFARHPGLPAITRQPVDLTVQTNANAKFTVSATGSGPITYQWSRDGAELPDATNSTLTLMNVTTNEGGLYRVIVANDVGAVTSQIARLIVTELPPPPSLASAVDATHLTWTTSGNAPWFAQTSATHDGADAAQSGAIGHSQTSTLQTTVRGPGTIGFWWRVSSEPSNDRLLFYIGSDEKSRITGNSAWQWKTFSVSSGTQTLKWTYSKNSSVTSNQDRAWLDEVIFVPNSELTLPVIAIQPMGTNVDAGSTVVLSVSAIGSPTLKYQWQHNGTNLVSSSSAGVSGATTSKLTLTSAQMFRSGDYTVIITNLAGAVTSAPAAVLVRPIPTLAEAVDAPALVWTTSGSPAWAGQYSVTRDGTDAARSGAIGNGTSCSMQATVIGPGTLTFWWKVSCETNNDRLRLYVNGSEKARISGEVDWQFRSFEIASGTQTLKWTYSKSDSTTKGQDRAWLDQVSFTPAAVPMILPLAAPGSVPVTILANENGGVTLQWPATPDRTFTVFYKDSLADEEWLELPVSITVDEAFATAIDTDAEGQRFYQVLAR